MDKDRDQLFETYRSSFRLLTSAVSFLLTAEVTIIGFAITNKSSSLVVLGILFPIFMLISYVLFSRLFCPIFICGIKGEISNPNGNSKFFSLALISANKDLYKTLLPIAGLDDFDIQMERIREISSSFIPPFVPLIMTSMAIVHLIAAISLWHFSGWSFI
ncbi:MAG: hypothetical protein ACR2RF_29880 [Geminicoccaceae bacterium]